MITKFKIYEDLSLFGFDLTKKYVVIKPIQKDNTDHYLLEIQDEMYQLRIVCKKLYTLRSDGKLIKNKHQFYSVFPTILKQITIYQSSNLKNALGVLESVLDAEKYNM